MCFHFCPQHQGRGWGTEGSAVQRWCLIMLCDTRFSDWPVSPLPSWPHFQLEGVFMVLTSLSTYPDSITWEQSWPHSNNSTCPASSTTGGTSLKHCTHIRGRNTCLEPILKNPTISFHYSLLDTTSIKSLHFAKYLDLCDLLPWLKWLPREARQTLYRF